MLAGKLLKAYRIQIRKQDLTKYKKMIRETLLLGNKTKSRTPMDIQSISPAISQRLYHDQKREFLVDCQLSNQDLFQFRFLACESVQIQEIVKKFKNKTDTSYFSNEEKEQFAKLLYFITQSVISNKKKNQKLNCILIVHSFLSRAFNINDKKPEAARRVICLANTLIKVLMKKLQNQGLDLVQNEFFSFLVYQKILFMKKTSLLTHHKLIDKSKSIIKMAIDLLFVNGLLQISEFIVNNSLRAIHQLMLIPDFWNTQQEKQSFSGYIQRSFELLQKKINSQLWNQNFILLQKIIYNKAVLLFQLNFELSQFIVSKLILQAIQFQTAYSAESRQNSELVLKLMFEYCIQTKYSDTRWATYCEKVVQRGFEHERAGMLEGLALMMLYELGEEGRKQLELLQIKMENTEFFRLYQHLIYMEVGKSMKQITERIFEDLVRQL